MKKLLYGTTALVAAGMIGGVGTAHAQWDVSVNGFMNQWFGYGDNEDDVLDRIPAAARDAIGRELDNCLVGECNDFNQWSNGEIHFNFSNTLDNGIRFGGRVELEGETSGDQIDEQYIFIDGDFGRVLLGSENSAGYLMTITAPNVGLPLNSGSTTQHIVSPFFTGSLFRTPLGSTTIEPAVANDSNKITYFTPRISGFQFGISYLPDTDQDEEAATPADKEMEYTNGVSAGINYVDNLFGVDVAASFGYFYMGGPDADEVLGSCTVVNPYGGSNTIDVCEDFQAISAGLNLGWGGWTVGGSYAQVFDGRLQSSGFDVVSGVNSVETTEGFGFDAGISYETGPWGASVTGYYGEEEGDVFTGGYNEYFAVSGSLRYTLGPGVAVIGSVGWVEYHSESFENNVVAGGAGADLDNEGIFATTGVALSF